MWVLIAIAVVTVAITAYGLYAAKTAAQQDPITGTAKKNSTSSDAETPWEFVYGDKVKGAHVAWAGVEGGKDELTGVDYVLACHPCDSVVSVQIGDLFMPITTNAAAAEGLILNANRSPVDSEYPTTWHVPVVASVWNRKDQSQNTSDKKSHVAMRIYYGTQTATDPHMATVFGTKYSEVDRKFLGHTAAHVIYRAHDELGTLSSVPPVKWRIKGKNNIALNDAGSSTGYTAATAAVLADIMKELSGIPASDIKNHFGGGGLASLITECNTTSWTGSGNTNALYEFHDVVRDDEDMVDIYERIARHMMGGYSERGDKVVFWTGTPRASQMDLTPDDFAGGSEARTTPVPQAEWVNTYIPHRVIRLALSEDDETQLYGDMEPAKKATEAAYITADGQVLQQDIKWEGCDLAKRARHMAHIALDMLRLGDTYTRKFKRRAMVLEIGDVYTVTDPDRFTQTKFRLIHKSMPDQDWAVELTGARYQDAIYNDRSVTEDAIGKLFKGRSGIMPLLSGLAIDIAEESAHMQADGRIKVDVAVSWNAVTKAQARAGGVKISWKKSINPWPGRNAAAAADETGLVIPGLAHGQTYDFRGRIEGVPTAGRAERPRGDWTYLLNQTIDALADETTPPRLPGEGQNLMEGGKFELKQHRLNNFSLTDSRVDGTADRLSNANMTVDFQNSGGFFGPWCLRVREAASSEPSGDTWRIGYEAYIPIEWGRIIKTGIGVIRTLSTLPVKFRLTLRFYGEDKGIIETQVLDDTLTINATGWHFFSWKGQAPRNAAFCRPQIEYKKSSSAGTACEIRFDGWYADDVPLMQSQLNEGPTTIPDANQVIVVGLGNRDVANQGYITSGTDELEIQWQVRGKVVGTGGTLTQATHLRARLIRNDYNNVLSDVIVTGLENVARLPIGATAADESIDVMFRFASEDAPPAGEWRYRVECSMNGDISMTDGIVTDSKIEVRRI